MFVDYKNLYKLKLEINMLLELLKENEEIELLKENEKLDDNNIDLLKEINSLVYEKEFVFIKKLNDLAKVISDINNKYWFHSDKDLDKYGTINGYLTKLELDLDDFNLYINTKEFIFNFCIQEHFRDLNDKLESKKVLLDNRVPINKLNEKQFLFNSNLIYKLYEAQKIRKYFDIDKNKELKQDGLYLVNFNLIYKRMQENTVSCQVFSKMPYTLIYKYLNYNTMFSELLVSYIEEVSKYNINMHNLNNTVFVIDESFKEYSKWDIDSIDEQYFNNKYNYNRHKYNIIKYILLLSRNKGPMYLNIDNIVKLLLLLYNRCNKDIIDFYLKNNIKDKFLRDKLNKGLLNLSGKHNENIIFNFVFLIKDLNSLLSQLKSLNVNGGPQKWRAECDYISSNLSIIDECFRSSMYNHYLDYHINNILPPFLNKTHFSFKNIHINLGEVRW